MTLSYHKVWNSMNELSETINNYIEIKKLLQSYNKNNDKFLDCIITLLDHYIEVQDKAFNVAWQETVNKIDYEDDGMRPWGHSDLEFGLANPTLTEDRNSNFPEENTICDKDDLSAECKNSWNRFWQDGIIEEDKVVKWQLPVEVDNAAGDAEPIYYVNFPDDLLEAANLKGNDVIEWVDQGDGSYLLKKIEKGLPTYEQLIKNGYKTYEEATADGWTMTADGFWIKE